MIKPYALRPGDTIGVFTPSSPGYESNPGLFENGVKNLRNLGFKVKLGSLTEKRLTQGYRSAGPQERAQEMMDLIKDPEVRGLIATIGGMNSNALIPYLDFKLIKKARKVICGFSDITSLHLAINKYSELITFYGPTVMCWFGEWPDGVPVSNEYFLEAVSRHKKGSREFACPKQWSNHSRKWDNGDWKTIPRIWNGQDSWEILSEGDAQAEIIPANLNTLLSACGTPYFPDLKGKILLIEDMDAPQSRTERGLVQLLLMGVFDQIKGLLIGKPEFYNQQDAPFSYEELILEVVGKRSYAIVSRFDCSHTNPMLTMPYSTMVQLKALKGEVHFSLLDGAIE